MHLPGGAVTRSDEHAILELEGINVRFGGLTALENVNLSVSKSEIFALLGPNGAGKTTLFNVIGGILSPDEGRVEFEGRSITGLRQHARCALGIGRTFQITKPFPELTVEENVMAGTITHHRRIADMRADAEKYVDFVGLGEKRHDFAKNLSTGQRKRLEVARVLATRPRLLLLDEITGGVDHASIPGLVELVLRLRTEGVTVVLVEHNMRVITELADRALFLDRGVVLARGTPQELAEHPDVIALYLESEHA